MWRRVSLEFICIQKVQQQNSLVLMNHRKFIDTILDGVGRARFDQTLPWHESSGELLLSDNFKLRISFIMSKIKMAKPSLLYQQLK